MHINTIQIIIFIHIGDTTHNHDQLITSHNFKIINAIVNTPQKLIPPLDGLDFVLILILYLINHTNVLNYIIN